MSRSGPDSRNRAGNPVLARVGAAILLIALTACGGGGGSTNSGAPAVAVSSCDQPAETDKLGNVIVPPEATNVTAPAYVEEDRGLLTDLYPDIDTSTDAFYAHQTCDPSIGGELPTLPTETDDEVATDAYLKDVETNIVPDIVAKVTENPVAPISSFASQDAPVCGITPVGSETPTPTACDSKLFLDDTQPFEGRDIIYVHGLAPQHLQDRLLHPPTAGGPVHPSNRVWPQDAGEFLNSGGYFRTYAENVWKSHIDEHLSQGWEWKPGDAAPVYVPKHNRYMLVAWSSSQTLEYAQDALIDQIYLAVTQNKNVVTPTGYPVAWHKPFCANGCIIISHSTGALVVSTAMAKALDGDYGDGGKQLTNAMKMHISFNGAISGSRLATMGLAIGLAPAIGSEANVVCPMVENVFGLTNACHSDTSFLASSILRDLVPAVSQGIWGSLVARSPIPTVTFPGGNPVGDFPGTGEFLPGIDDGVVNMNSACGNPLPVLPGITPPSGVTVSSLVKAFDMTENGGRLLRSIRVMDAQLNLKALPPTPNYLAASCSPWLSPTGMVLPVIADWSGTANDARRRYPNYYSFVQSLSQHSNDGGKTDWPSTLGDPAGTLREYRYFGDHNIEESRAVTDPAIYTRLIDNNGTHLVKPIPVHEVVRGRMVGFNLPFNIGGCHKVGIANYYCKRWLWKRTYHLLDKWEQKQSSHYAYEFVGRR